MIPDTEADCPACELAAARSGPIHYQRASNDAAARLLRPFVERAWGDPDAERIMRDGLSFLAGFCRGGNVRADEEPGMLAAARNYLASAA